MYLLQRNRWYFNQFGVIHLDYAEQFKLGREIIVFHGELIFLI